MESNEDAVKPDSSRDDVEADEGDLKSQIKRLEQVVVPELKEKLKKCQSERDGAKASLIEVEIAKHEVEENMVKLESDLKMRITQLTTEKETLEVTLSLRDNDLKNRKEDSRKDQENFDKELKNVRQLVDAKSMQISALQAESSSLKAGLLESKAEFTRLSDQHENLIQNCAVLTAKCETSDDVIDSKDREIKDVQERLEHLHRDFEDMVSMNHQLEGNLCEVKDDFTQLNGEFESVKSDRDDLKESLASSQSKVEELESKIQESEDQFPSRLENSSLVQDLRQTNLQLSDELAEKKQVRLKKNIYQLTFSAKGSNDYVLTIFFCFLLTVC